MGMEKRFGRSESYSRATRTISDTLEAVIRGGGHFRCRGTIPLPGQRSAADDVVGVVEYAADGDEQ